MAGYVPQVGGDVPDPEDPVSSAIWEYSALRSTGVAAGTLLAIPQGGGVSSKSTNWLFSTILATGVLSGPNPATGLSSLNLIQVNEQVDNSALPGTLSALQVVHRLGGGATAGVKQTIEANLGVSGTVGGVVTTGYKSFVAMQANAYAVSNVGGTGGGNPVNYAGGLFGGNDHPRLAVAATYWASVVGREINLEIQSGASAFSKIGIWIVKGSVDTSRGEGVDAAIAIVDNAVNNTPWKNGLLFGGPTGIWAFGSDSVLIGAQRKLYPSAAAARSMVADYGVDFRDITFTTAPFASNDFSVNDAGYITAMGLTVPDRTVTVSTPLINLQQSWNAGAVPFTMITTAIPTATAAAASYLWSHSVGGVTMLTINALTGIILLPAVSATGLIFGGTQTAGGGTWGLDTPGNGQLGLHTGGAIRFVASVNATAVRVASGWAYGWANSTNAGTGTVDTTMWRDGAAGAIAFRKDATAHLHRIYYTWTDASNYVRAAINPASAYVELAAESAGTGAGNRAIRLTPSGTSGVEVVAAGNGQLFQILAVTELLTIAAAATSTTTLDLPAGAIILAVSTRVTTVIPTAATFTVTGNTSSTVFHTAAVAVAAGTTDRGTAAGAYYNATAQKVRITPSATPAANTGRVRVTVHYMIPVPATS